jgi:ABC-2 type transport system ATP-binding protein
VLELKSRGKTVLLCSHLLADVEDVCDRIAILKTGKLRITGAVKELLSVRDVTQIRARNISPDTVEVLKRILTERSVADFEVSHPHTTLEELFLRVVGQADAEDIARSGSSHGE